MRCPFRVRPFTLRKHLSTKWLEIVRTAWGPTQERVSLRTDPPELITSMFWASGPDNRSSIGREFVTTDVPTPRSRRAWATKNEVDDESRNSDSPGSTKAAAALASARLAPVAWSTRWRKESSW